MRATICGLVLMLLATHAIAEPGALVVAGKSSARDQATATRALTDALRTAGWVLPDKPPSKTDTAAVTRCFKDASPPECALQVIHGARRVAYVSIDPDPKVSTGLQITARLVVASVSSVMTETQYCDHCTDDSIASSATAAIKRLLDRLSVENGRTVLSIRSVPQGAHFSLDGTMIGTTDSLIDVTPGQHQVGLEYDGYETETRTVDALEGKTAEISVTLHKQGTHSEAPHPPESTNPGSGSGSGSGEQTSPVPVSSRRSIALPVTLFVVGGVAILGGAVALAFDESPSSAPAGQPQRQFYYDTTTPGLVTIGAGVIIAGLGGVLLWTGSHDDKAPSVSLVPGGATLNFAGTF